MATGGTRLQLIEVAERLFAERGINGVSLREIGAEAGQRNTGAARYHFGSKDGLVDAVFRHRMEPINERRLAMLAAVEGNDVRGLTEAFVYPLSEQLGDVGRPSWYLRFLVQAAFVQASEATRQEDQPWTRGVSVLQRRMEAALAELGRQGDAAGDRWLLFGGFVVHALADREQALQYTPRRDLSPRQVFLAQVIDAAVAIATAPVTQLADHRRPA